MRRDTWGGVLWWSCQSPLAHSCSFLNHPNSFHRGIFKLNTIFDADWLLYSLSHFECDGHTLHMLTQWRSLPSLTSIVKSSLFTHAHSSPLSLAARFHWHHTHWYYINNGWTSFGQTSYILWEEGQRCCVGMYMFSKTFFYVAVSASFHIYVGSRLKADEKSFGWYKI